MADQAVARRVLAAGLGSVPVLLFFLSGFSSLIYEVVWMRWLTTVLGGTVSAVSIILAVFLGGLAAGNRYFGFLADRKKCSWSGIFWLEIGIAVSGLATTILVSRIDSVYVFLFRQYASGMLGYTGVRLGLCAMLFFIPTFLMGATSPFFVRVLAARASRFGGEIGRLYAGNTVGAAAGSLAAGHFLIGALGLQKTAVVAAAINISVALGARWMSRRREDSSGCVADRLVQPDVERADEPTDWIVWHAVALSGFAALGYQIVWTRMLLPYLGVSVYAFSAAVGVFLFGTGWGSLAASPYADRSRRPIFLLGCLHFAIGAYLLAGLYFGAGFEHYLLALRRPFPDWFGGRAILKAFAVFFLPSAFLGGTFPIAGRIFVASRVRMSRDSGMLWAWNTLGGVFGALVTGFILLPQIGTEGSLVTLLSINLFLGVILCARQPRSEGLRKWCLPAGLAVAAVFGLALRPKHVLQKQNQRYRRAGENIRFYADNPQGVVTVLEQDARRILCIDDIPLAGTDMEIDDKWVGHLPMLLHPDPKTAFLVGFGAGVTAHAMGTYSELTRLDVAEFNSDVLRSARFFSSLSGDILSDPRVHAVVDDGKHALLTSPHSYDVIAIDGMTLLTAGAGTCFTNDFFRLCREKMSARGILAADINIKLIPPDYLRILVRTARSVFPHVSLWWSGRMLDLMMISAKSPPVVDFQLMRARMERPAIKADLAAIGVAEAGDFLQNFVADGRRLSEYAKASGPLNSYDFPILEYGMPRDRLRFPFASVDNVSDMARLKSSVVPLLSNLDPPARERLLRQERSFQRTMDAWMLAATGGGSLDRAVDSCRSALKLYPGNQEARYWLARFRADAASVQTVGPSRTAHAPTWDQGPFWRPRQLPCGQLVDYSREEDLRVSFESSFAQWRDVIRAACYRVVLVTRRSGQKQRARRASSDILILADREDAEGFVDHRRDVALWGSVSAYPQGAIVESAGPFPGPRQHLEILVPYGDPEGLPPEGPRDSRPKRCDLGTMIEFEEGRVRLQEHGGSERILASTSRLSVSLLVVQGKVERMLGGVETLLIPLKGAAQVTLPNSRHTLSDRRILRLAGVEGTKIVVGRSGAGPFAALALEIRSTPPKRTAFRSLRR